VKILRKEVASNFERFSASWTAEMLRTQSELDKRRPIYSESYARLTSLQAWRTFLQEKMDEDSLGFFLEAQNDALISHVLARLGSWRQALKSLRSCLENVLFCLYYKDHPIELELWHQGKHRMTFSGLCDYFDHHPKLLDLSPNNTGLPVLKTEYSTLSRAVHASAKGFRMTSEVGSTLLWSSKASSVGAWATRESTLLSALNLLLMSLFRTDLRGTYQQNLRKAISLTINSTKHPSLKKDLNITLFGA
jgi:hypothetical protein